MTAFHRVFTTAAAALALTAASSSSATASVRVTTYVKGSPVGITVRGSDPATVGQVCNGLAGTSAFTRCRAGGSRYPATACAWRITSTTDRTWVVMTVTASRAMLAAIRPTVCPAVARTIRGTPGFRVVRLK